MQVSEMILNNEVLEFYKWDGDVKEKLAAVKDRINELADTWTREQKDHCLEETQVSFKVGVCPLPPGRSYESCCKSTHSYGMVLVVSALSH